MSRTRVHRPSRRDANEPAIVEALRRAGADVWLLEAPAPFDLLVGFCGAFHALEVKNPEAEGHQAGRVKPSQAEFFARCSVSGLPAKLVRTPAEALRAIGVTAYDHRTAG